MSRARLAALAAPALLAGAAIGQATSDPVVPAPVVVTVEARGERAATGFAVGGGRVLTVAHAVGDGPVVVRGPGGAALAATVLRRDARADVALLAVPGLPRAAPLARAPAVAGHVVLRRDGTRVPVTALRRVDARIRAGDGRLLARRPALELRAAIGAGDSGAPVLGPDGRVAGVVFARSRDRPGTGYAVAASALAGLLP